MLNFSVMKKEEITTINGNGAIAHTAYMLTEAAPIYPITPSSDMAEYCDEWASRGVTNAFGKVPEIIEMQSEAGAAGTLHGILLGGALGTTFTSSQGLLLMIPNMYKIVGELLPAVFHVSARTVAAHALSIFGDHSDVYACRQTGVAMLASNSVQEAADMSLLSHLAAIEASYPFLHFIDGFRTSHEFNKISMPAAETAKKLLNQKALAEFRARALNPDKPRVYGTAQNPDTYFQNREACNTAVDAIPRIVQNYMDGFAKETGRAYKLFDYAGVADAEHIIVAMGSVCETIEETLPKLKGKYGLIKVRLYRPFAVDAFINQIPKTAKTITVLDRTKENGAVGDPLYTDVCSALFESGIPNIKVLAGRYGLSGKEFTPDMAAGIFNNSVKNHFTVGIDDDVTHMSLDIIPRPDLHEAGGCRFYGLGSDGTVGANRNSVSIIGDNTGMYAQAYFVYDSKKSGGTTVSHLRFSAKPIKSTYLVTHPTFVACHNQTFLAKFDMLDGIADGGTFLLNTTYGEEKLNDILPNAVKRVVAAKHLNFYIINAYSIAKDLGLGGRINTIMQSAFFKLTNIMDFEAIKGYMKKAIDKSYGKKGAAVVEMNYRAVDSADANLVRVAVPKEWANLPAENGQPATDTVGIIEAINGLQGDKLPVSAFSADGHTETATTKYEKRNIATQLPQWRSEHCIQCNRCAFVCPHACIRPHLLEAGREKPETFKTIKATGVPNMPDAEYRIQVSPRDCTGCGACANVCPARMKALVMTPFEQIKEDENYEYSLGLPYPDTEPVNVKMSQFRRPLFEFSGACAGCGETPYIKLLTQLYGDRMIIANATGCSSIYGASSPTCPYAKNAAGQGPAWANSLFEDNAEFGFGIRKALNAAGKTDKVVWVIGGDGWAYDIGFGGLDHILSTDEDINVLVLDTEVYSNTGGQASKSTPMGAAAKFASGGKRTGKKDLGAMMMQYPNCYVAQVAMGANYEHTLRVLKEAAEHKGPSLVIAMCTCINHGIDMSNGMKIMADAVKCGYTKLYHRPAGGELVMDSAPPTGSIEEFKASQTRFRKI
jgi:pyruvate-ferredoxin/flavodoxin oxidoreductase